MMMDDDDGETPDQERKTRNTSSTGRRHIGQASAAPAHAAQKKIPLLPVPAVDDVLGGILVEGLAPVFDVADAAAGLVDGLALAVAVVGVVGVGARGVDRADCVSDDWFRDAPHGDQ